MINLTEFIGQKLNKPSFVSIKNKDKEKKLVSNRKY